MGAFILVPITLSILHTALRSHYVLKRKPNGKFKARLCPDGSGMKRGIHYDTACCPTPSATANRMFMAVCVMRHWIVHTDDTRSAFVHEAIDNDNIYIKPPQGFADYLGAERMKSFFDKYGDVPFLLWVRRAIYGLRQAGHLFYKGRDAALRFLGFVRCDTEPCVMQHTDGDVLVTTHVDDAATGTPRDSPSRANKYFQPLVSKGYLLEDNGPIQLFLGAMYVQTLLTMTCTISAYISNMLAERGLTHVHSDSTPFVDDLVKLPPAAPGQEHDKSTYLSLTGALNFAARYRPDIAFVTRTLCARMAHPTKACHGAAKRVLTYLQGTKQHGIKWSSSGTACNEGYIVGYCDSDWGSNIDGKSVCGYVFYLYDRTGHRVGLLSWRSKGQGITALSSCEAEWIGLVMATKEAIYLNQLLQDMGVTVTRPPLIYNDNEGALSWVSDPTHLERRRHIRIRRSFIEDAYENKLVTFSWCSSDDNEADFFTKALTRAKFVSQRSRIVGW